MVVVIPVVVLEIATTVVGTTVGIAITDFLSRKFFPRTK